MPRRRTSHFALERLAAGEELTPKLIAEEAERGDELSLEIIFETARYLGIGTVNVMHVVDPDVVLLGGAMTFGGAEASWAAASSTAFAEKFAGSPARVGREYLIDFATSAATPASSARPAWPGSNTSEKKVSCGTHGT